MRYGCARLSISKSVKLSLSVGIQTFRAANNPGNFAPIALLNY
jgi:hypothetical protein